MLIGVPRELQPGEHRAAMIPASVQKLVRAGAEVMIESGLGLGAGHSDEEYATAGARVAHDRAALLGAIGPGAAPAQAPGGGDRAAQARRDPRQLPRSVQRDRR